MAEVVHRLVDRPGLGQLRGARKREGNIPPSLRASRGDRASAAACACASQFVFVHAPAPPMERHLAVGGYITESVIWSVPL